MRFAAAIPFFVVTIFMTAACAPSATAVPATSAPSPTVTPIPATATATPDPNMPADATGRNGIGEWTKSVTVAGKDVTYVFKEIRISSEEPDAEMAAEDTSEPLFRGWFRLLTPEPIPAWESQGTNYLRNGQWTPARNVMPISVWMAEGVPGGDSIMSLTHWPIHRNRINLDPYPGSFIPFVSYRFFDGKLPDVVPDDDWQAMRSGVQDDSPSTSAMPFTVDGAHYTWAPSPNVGSSVYIMRWEDSEPREGNRWLQWHDYTNKDWYRSSFWGTDAKGNLIGGFASEKPLNELDDQQVRWLTLLHTLTVIQQEDVTEHGFNPTAYHLADLAGAAGPPYIVVTR